MPPKSQSAGYKTEQMSFLLVPPEKTFAKSSRKLRNPEAIQASLKFIGEFQNLKRIDNYGGIKSKEVQQIIRQLSQIIDPD
jgi:hypothetical protein